jgi:hypothetical protein
VFRPPAVGAGCFTRSAFCWSTRSPACISLRVSAPKIWGSPSGGREEPRAGRTEVVVVRAAGNLAHATLLVAYDTPAVEAG